MRDKRHSRYLSFSADIATASPISDLNPVLVASNATLTLARLDPMTVRETERDTQTDIETENRETETKFTRSLFVGQTH